MLEPRSIHGRANAIDEPSWCPRFPSSLHELFPRKETPGGARATSCQAFKKVRFPTV